MVYTQFRVETLVSQLRSAPLFDVVYALLFHQLLFDNQVAEACTVKNMRLFLDGATALFAMVSASRERQSSANRSQHQDLEAYRFTYRPLYQQLRRVLAAHRRWFEAMQLVLCDLWSLWASYSFYYERDLANVDRNLKHMRLQLLLAESSSFLIYDGVWRRRALRCVVLRVRHAQVYKPEAGARFGLAQIDDLFVRLAVQQLGAIKDERVLIRFLRGMRLFSRLQLSRMEAERLKSEL